MSRPETLGGLLEGDVPTDPVVTAASSGREYGLEEFRETAYKVGNVLRYLGVHGGASVVIDPVPRAETVLSAFGAWLLGARTTFEAGDPHTDGDGSVVVAPVERESALEEVPGRSHLLFGGEPEDPAGVHWEAAVWSENPAFPRVDVDPDSTALRGDGTDYSHRRVLSAAVDLAEVSGFDPDAFVAADSYADPGAVVAGIVAPLLAGSTVVVDSAADASTDATVTHRVGPSGDLPPETVPL